MKFCPQCGTELIEGAKFCASCGFQIPAQQQVPPPPPVAETEPQLVKPQQEPIYEQAKEATNAFKDAVTGKTNLVQRVINILAKPKEEWQVIANEKPDVKKILFGYVLILALIPAIINFLSLSLISSLYSFNYAIIQAVISFILTVATVYLTAYIVDLLAPSFESEKNFERSFQLVSYSYTPGWIASLLGIIPGINILAVFAGFAYTVYLLIVGLPVLKKTPQDKSTGYAILLVVIMLILYFLIRAIFALLFLKTIFRGLI